MSPGERWDRRAPARPKDSPTRAGARGTQSSQSSQSSQGNAKDRRSVEYGWRSRGYLPHIDAPRAIQHIPRFYVENQLMPLLFEQIPFYVSSQ